MHCGGQQVTITIGSHVVKWRPYLRVVETQQLVSILQERRTLEIRRSRMRDPAFRIVATPSRTAAATADWPTGASAVGPPHINTCHAHSKQNNPTRAPCTGDEKQIISPI